MTLTAPFSARQSAHIGSLPGRIMGLLATLSFCFSTPALAQVSPEEIRNPQLRELETAYLSQMKEVHKAVESEKFPLPFILSRYVGLDPARQAGTDTRGIEFVRFHERIVLKVSGSYNAAYNADRLSQNERASRTFTEVIVPLLNHVARIIPEDVDCDGIGFEISFHVRRAAKGYDYEGKEIIVVVFDTPDAFSFPKVTADSARQEILNRSEIYLNGKPYGLALGAKDPFDPEELTRSAKRGPVAPPPSTASAALAGARLARTKPGLLPKDSRDSKPANRNSPTSALSADNSQTVSSERTNDAPADEAKSSAVVAPAPAPDQAFVDQMQSKYREQLDALAAIGKAKFHFVDYAQPSFVLFQNRVVLQITLRNISQFDPASSSIYKRAAQTFDLFVAPQLKDLLAKIPAGQDFNGLDISVVNALYTPKRESSEAVEFICPLNLLRRFADAEITSQDVINQSVVLVNGVRIALTLQLVE